MINFQPIGREILVEIPMISKTTESGVIKSEKMIEEEKKNMDKFLTVLEVGNEVQQIKQGDKIYITNGKHPQIELDGKLYAIINELHVLGKKKK